MIEIGKATEGVFDDLVLPGTLYKYRDWHDKYHRRMISNQEVFFASPNSFKDKLDCKNPTRWDLLTYGDILDKYYQESIRAYPHLSIDERIVHAIHWANHSRVNVKEYVDEHQTRTFAQSDAQTGVLSLTAYPLEEKMWHEYGIKHTGFCVGFDPKIMLKGLGSGGGIVQYEDELPIIYPSPKHSFMEQNVLQIFVKLREWSFEKEYRAYIFRPYTLTTEERTIIVPPEGFKEIILGANMDKKDERLLINSIPKELNHVCLKKAVLEIDGITIVNY